MGYRRLDTKLARRTVHCTTWRPGPAGRPTRPALWNTASTVGTGVWPSHEIRARAASEPLRKRPVYDAPKPGSGCPWRQRTAATANLARDCQPGAAGRGGEGDILQRPQGRDREGGSSRSLTHPGASPRRGSGSAQETSSLGDGNRRDGAQRHCSPRPPERASSYSSPELRI